MFSAPTRRAMLALAAGDLEGTQADRDAFARFLGSMCGGPSVITKKAVAAQNKYGWTETAQPITLISNFEISYFWYMSNTNFLG